METGTVLGGLSLAIAGLTALNSLRKTKIEDRSGTAAELRVLITTYKEEIDRLEARIIESEAECQQEIKRCEDRAKAAQALARNLQEMIIEQANRISMLERRGKANIKTRASDGEQNG